MGLRRSDIDLQAMRLTVGRSVSEVGGRLVVKGPNSRAGLRTIVLPEGLREDIQQHLVAYAEDEPEARLFVGKRATPCTGRTRPRTGPPPGRRPIWTRVCTCTTCGTRVTTSQRPRVPAHAS